MNPLDPIEFKSFNDRLNKEMPFHTPRSYRMPFTFGPLPKNIMEDVSIPTDNRFLNKYQHIIEEMLHRDPKNIYVKDFRNYQNNYFSRYGILKGDGFFKKILHSKHRGLGSYGNPFISFGGHVNGGTLETTTNTGVDDTIGADTIQGALLPNATIGEFYDQQAIKGPSGGASGNLRLTVYDDLAGYPNNRMTPDTGIFAAAGSGDYTYHALSEFAISSIVNWASVTQSSGTNLNYDEGGGTSNYYGAFTFGALPNPFPLALTHTTGFITRQKIGHS